MGKFRGKALRSTAAVLRVARGAFRSTAAVLLVLRAALRSTAAVLLVARERKRVVQRRQPARLNEQTRV